MEFKIYKNGELINNIIASEQFCKKYCFENNFTYELIEPEQAEPEPRPTDTEVLNILLGVNEE